MQILKKHSNIYSYVKNDLVFLGILFAFSLTLNSIVSATMSYIFISLILANFIQSSSYLQKIALSVLLPIILSPIYLVIRGFFIKDSLTSFDLQIYLGFFYFCTSLLARNKKLSFSSIDFHRQHLRKLFAAMSSFLFLILLEIYLRTKSIGDAVAWVMSGDSKGHVVFASAISKMGWLDPSTFLLQPISAPSFMSLLLSQENQELFSPPELLTYQLQIYTQMWVLFLGLLGLTAAATAEILWKLRNNTEPPVLVLVLAALLPLFSIISGPATFDGFFTAVLSIVTILALINWFFEASSELRFSFNGLTIGGLLCLGTVMSWMFVGFFTIPLFIVGLWNLAIYKAKNKRAINIFFLIAIFGSLAIAHYSNYVQGLNSKAKLAFGFSGVINATNPELYFALILATLVAGLVFQVTKIDSSKLFIQLSVLNIGSLLIFKYFGHLGIFEWNYYMLKYQWILTANLFIILSALTFVLLAVLLGRNSSKIKNLSSGLILVIAALMIFFVSESENTTKNVWIKALRGWENPRSTIANQIMKTDFDNKNPTLFFHHGYHGDSMLGNFWLTAYLDQQEPIKGWNYTIDTNGDVQQLCDVNSYYKTVKVITYDQELVDSLREKCPTEVFDVEVEPTSEL